MKAVILAGGLGSRLSEETTVKPKPMVEIGGQPILWHIMKMYTGFGITDFVICLGYKGYVIKEYFANYALHTSDVTFDMERGSMDVHESTTDPWRVTLVDTGAETMTGGRLKRVARYVADDGPFCMTYGDGLSDIDLQAVVDFHRREGRAATVTTVQPPGRWGSLEIDDGVVRGFQEKPHGDAGGWINGGFFVLEPRVLDLIEGDGTVWEREPMETLAASGELGAYQHEGFWQAMDTLRDRKTLEDAWATGRAPWRTWA